MNSMCANGIISFRSKSIYPRKARKRLSLILAYPDFIISTFTYQALENRMTLLLSFASFVLFVDNNSSMEPHTPVAATSTQLAEY